MAMDLGDLEQDTTDCKEIEERDKNTAWQLKGVACQISCRLVQKFGNLSFTPNKDFANLFCKNFAEQLLETSLHLISK